MAVRRWVAGVVRVVRE